MMPPPFIIEFLVDQAIHAGIAACVECEQVLAPDDDVMATCCEDCGKISIYHVACLPDDLARMRQQSENRLNARLN